MTPSHSTENFNQLGGAHYGIAPQNQQQIRKMVSQFDKSRAEVSHE